MMPIVALNWFNINIMRGLVCRGVLVGLGWSFSYAFAWLRTVLRRRGCGIDVLRCRHSFGGVPYVARCRHSFEHVLLLKHPNDYEPHMR